MTSSSILERVAARRDGSETKYTIEDDVHDDFGAFGWLRGAGARALMLELRKRDGNIIAFSYSWLERAEFDPSIGITLKFGSQEIRMVGCNLNNEVRPNVQLFSGILRQQVPWVKEEGDSLKNSAKIHVEKITIT